MCDFIKVENSNDVRFSKGWRACKKFNCEGRLINKKNEFVKISYPGTQYLIMWKRERDFSICERISRFTKYVFYSLLTLGLCNFKKSYRELITKNTLVRRYAVKFKMPRIEFQEMINIENSSNTRIDPKTAGSLTEHTQSNIQKSDDASTTITIP